MSNEEKYLLVEESIAPDIFKKVLEAKKYLATGKARNSSEAVHLADISRSAIYKYKAPPTASPLPPCPSA